MNAAHGGDFSWSNRPDRERALKAAAAPPNPAEPVPEPQALELPLTNVHCVLIGQLDVFTKVWAELAHTKQIGLAQRFLFSFAVRQCTAKKAWNRFLEEVALPVLEQVFTIVLRRLGPCVPIPPDCFRLTEEQETAVDNLAEIRALFEARESARVAFRQAMPKTMYWLGTSIMLNHILQHCWPHALRGTVPETFSCPTRHFAALWRLCAAGLRTGMPCLACRCRRQRGCRRPRLPTKRKKTSCRQC